MVAQAEEASFRGATSSAPAERDEEDREGEQHTVARWTRFVLVIRRIARRRRTWSALGAHLKHIKERGRHI